MKILAMVVAMVLVVCILGTTGYIGFKTGRYMLKQNFNFSMALEWAWRDYKSILEKIFATKAEEEVIEYNMINRYIDIMPCVNLKWY